MGDLGHHAEVVGDEQHAGAAPLLQLADQPQDLRLGGHVERRGRLVGDQQRGIEHQGGGDHDALALAARHLVRIDVDQALGLGQVHGAHDLQHALAPVGLGELGVDLQHLGDLLAHRHDRVQRGHRLLEDHGHARAAQVAQARRGRLQHVLALRARASPALAASSRGSRPITAWAVTDLPEPDSPTTHTISPAPTEKVMFSIGMRAVRAARQPHA